MKQNLIATICGAIFCLVTTFGGFYLFYYFNSDYLKANVPFLHQ